MNEKELVERDIIDFIIGMFLGLMSSLVITIILIITSLVRLL
jgi:hypothetical protein